MPWHKKPQNLPSTTNYQVSPRKKNLLQWSHTVLYNGLLRLYTKISTTTSIQQPLSRRWWWCWCKWRANVLVLTWTSERAPTHSLLLWLGWSLNAYYSTFGVCVWVCVRRVMCFVVCGWWMLLFLFASNRLWLLLFTLSQGFFLVSYSLRCG